MNASNLLNTKAAYTAAGVLALGLVVYLAVRALAGKASEAAAAVGNAVNPASDQNLANRAVTATGRVLTGDQSFSLGSWLYDLTHESYDPNKPIKRAPTIREDAGRFTDALKAGGFW